MRIYVIGCPHDIGGAGPHCWHTAKLWRQYGLDVCFVAINPVEESWKEKLLSIGCEINYHLVGNNVRQVKNVEGLPGGITVSFCNDSFLDMAPQLRILGCKTVWLGCMNFLHDGEKRHYERWGPFTRYIFQSQFQQQSLSPQLNHYGYNDVKMIRIPSPICLDEYQFKPLPHEGNEPFSIGRISRPDPAKFVLNMWDIYGSIKANVRVRIMAWNDELQAEIGPPPLWAECLPGGQESALEFMSKLHCMVQIGRILENRPRSCLEAMACGVPVVATNDGGWKELIRHGHNGFLCNSPDEVGYYVARLAEDEDFRLGVVETARDELKIVANPDEIWSKWESLFEQLQCEI